MKRDLEKYAHTFLSPTFPCMQKVAYVCNILLMLLFFHDEERIFKISSYQTHTGIKV
jgi:hypothetical protein